MEAGSRRCRRTAPQRRLHQARRQVDDARRRAVRLHDDVPADGVINRLGMIAAQMWTQAGVPVTAEVSNRQLAPSGGRRLRGQHRLVGRDLGRSPRPLVLPRQLPLQLHRPSRASSSRRATGCGGRIPSSTGSSRRSAPSISTIRAHRTRPRVRQAPPRGNAEHSGHDLQRVRGHVGAYWTGCPTSENPYANPVNNWANARYILTQLAPVEADVRRCRRVSAVSRHPPSSGCGRRDVQQITEIGRAI